MDTIKYKGYNIFIGRDEHTESPRDWDNLGTMVCWHNRYGLLGDNGRPGWKGWMKEKTPDDFVIGCFEHYYETEEEKTIPEMFKMLQDKMVILPLFLYDHSGLAMSTSNKGYPFNDKWDAGQVGWMFCPNEDAVKEYGEEFKDKWKEKAIECLMAEVEIYNQYLQGDVWQFWIETETGVPVDSCGGFYGYDECLKEAKDSVDNEVSIIEAKEYKRLVEVCE